jgi:hypothetical protein
MYSTLQVIKYSLAKCTGQLLAIREVCWQVIDVKTHRMALIMLSCKKRNPSVVNVQKILRET